MHRCFARAYATVAVILFALMNAPSLARAAEGATAAAPEPASGVGVWVSLLLLAPGVLGLWVAAAREHPWSWSSWKGAKEEETDVTAWTNTGAVVAESRTSGGNRFLVAAVAGTIWIATLAILARFVTEPEGKVYFFHQDLTFPLFVPIFGFIGALLYVLDLSRRGREDIPTGTEFGMRLIMGPYVAIVMVALFGKNLGLVNLDSAIGQAALAFFSGLLVTLAFQGMIEKGQEVLGRWRERERYVPSEIARRFNLSIEEDGALRKAGLTRIVQLQERSEDDLKDAVRKVGFDEHLLVAFKREAAKDMLEKKIGPLAREHFAKDAHAKSIEDIAHLNDDALDRIAQNGGGLAKQGLMEIRDEAKTVIESLKAA